MKTKALTKPIDDKAIIPLLEIIKFGTCTDEQREAIAGSFDLYTEFFKVEIDRTLTDLSWSLNPAMNPYKRSTESIEMTHQTKLAILAFLLQGTYTEQDRSLIAKVFHLYHSQNVYTVRDEHERQVFLNVLNKE